MYSIRFMLALDVQIASSLCVCPPPDQILSEIAVVSLLQVVWNPEFINPLCTDQVGSLLNLLSYNGEPLVIWNFPSALCLVHVPQQRTTSGFALTDTTPTQQIPDVPPAIETAPSYLPLQSILQKDFLVSLPSYGCQKFLQGTQCRHLLLYIPD